MPDLTPAEARAFLAALEALTKQYGIALAGASNVGGTMELYKVDPSGSYSFSEGNLKDGSVVFDEIEWVEPKG